jgi:phospholipid/cholesterol/gamma-HCH transport system substrate-binding protein
MSKRTTVNLVFFLGVFGVMLWWAANNIITIDFLERPYEISGTFEQSAGLMPNAEVTYLGVNHGRVSRVELVPGGVDVTMKIHRDHEIPADSIARVFRKSAIGEPYIDFVPRDGSLPDDFEVLAPGAHVPIEDTTVPLEFADLLRSASEVISSIDPQAAASLLDELAALLDGRSGDLRRLTTSVDRLTTTFAARTEQLDRLADNSTRVTAAVAAERESLGRAIDNLALIADTLDTAADDVGVLLDVGTRFLGTTADLVAERKPEIDCILSDLESVIGLATTPERLEGLDRLLRDGPTAFGYVYNTLDEEPDGTWVRVNLLLALENPPPVYHPPRQLPAVPTVPACDSTLVAAPGSFRAEQAAAARPVALSSRPADTLPATGASSAPLAALVLGAAGWLTWRTRRVGQVGQP